MMVKTPDVTELTHCYPPELTQVVTGQSWWEVINNAAVSRFLCKVTQLLQFNRVVRSASEQSVSHLQTAVRPISLENQGEVQSKSSSWLIKTGPTPRGFLTFTSARTSKAF